MMTASVGVGSVVKSGGLYCGIASQASLVLVKTGRTGGQNHNGRGSRYIIREADIQRALAGVLANQKRFNIRVVNISLGGDPPANGKLNKLDRMVEEAVEQGMVVVTAAGNRGTEGLVPPASAPSAITVGGLDARNTLDRSLWRLYSSN